MAGPDQSADHGPTNGKSGAGSAPASAAASGGADVMLPLSHYAMLVGLCQFIPVPFVDDWIQQRLLQRVAREVLQRRGRRFPIDDLRPLYAPERGMLGAAGSAARALVLKPVKKLFRTVFIVFGARRAVLAAAEVLLLGHTLDRLLAAGWLTDAASPHDRRDQAARLGRAVARAWAGADRRALTDLIRRSGQLLVGRDGKVEPPSTASATGSATATRMDEADVDRLEQSLPPEQRNRLKDAARRLATYLRSGEGRSWLTRFDEAVDRHLAAGR